MLQAKLLHDFGYSDQSKFNTGDHLSYRLQKVILYNNKTEYDWTSPHRCVPEGTILGPPLVNLYINSLHIVVQVALTIQCADDTLIYSAKENELYSKSKMSQNIVRLFQTFKMHHLIFFPTKRMCKVQWKK